MLLAMVPANVLQAEAVSAGQKIYFQGPSWWGDANAWTAAYFFGNGTEWVTMTKNSAGIYEATIPSKGYPSVSFVRMNPSYSTGTWGGKWNQTQDLSIPTDSRNFFTGTGKGDKIGGSWSTYSDPNAKDYYLIGWINGADYGCEDDYQNMGNYKFVNGKLTVRFNQESSVYIKTTGNADWYMTQTYATGTSATFYNTSTGADEKMKVPGNVDVTFTLTENSDGTLTLSYTTSGSVTPPETTPTNPTETTPTTPPSETLPTSSTERIIYFDATLSKLSYEGNGGNTIPSGNNKVYCHYWIQGSGGTTKEMTKLNTVVRGDNEYSDLYYARISKSATHVLFFSSNSSSKFPNNSAQTADQKLPTDASNNCFYADSSDSCLFADAKRNGYWGEVCNIRSAEFMKNTDIVDIQTGTIPNLDPKKAIYINTTLYDYYTDYELNGNNRDGFSYTSDSKHFASHRVWVPFRHFNQALSDYYSKENALVPIYTGHFQPDILKYGFEFNNIESNMDLYGYMDGQAYVPLSTSQNGFMSVNNSVLDIDGGQPGWERAAQGIVHDQLSADGSLLIDDKNQGTAPMPYFNEAFINGNNSKNTKLGEVYKNVKFPFTKNETTGYWEFDSNNTILQMKQESSGAYFLQSVTKSNNYLNRESDNKSKGTYGFFPFNNTASANAATYNYGYAARIDVKFNLTPDGMIDGKPIVFEFSGDDDVWVFIDGQLALDIGGTHTATGGKIDFSNAGTEKTATVYSVKSSGGSSTNGKNVEKKFNISGKNTDEHTLTMFYMERGMWESNMKLTFNFFPVPETTMNVMKVWENVESANMQPVQVQLQSQDATGNWGNVETPVTLSAANDWRHAFTGLDYDLKYRVVELKGQNEVIPNGGLTDNNLIVNYSTVTGTADTGYSQTITNKTQPAGQLRITKAVSNGSIGDWTLNAFEIQVKIDNANPKNGTYPVEGGNRSSVSCTDGVIALKSGETAIIPVAAGSSYSVVEVNDRHANYMANYVGTVTSGTAPSVTSTGVSGTLNSGASASVVITNHQVGNQVVVIDFGIPVDIDVVDSVLGKMSGELVGIGAAVTPGFGSNKLLSASSIDAAHGTATINNDKVRYTPSDMLMDAPDVIGYSVEYKEINNTTKYYHSTVTVVPATNIYYEDSFLTFTNANGGSDSVGNWVEVNEEAGSTQQQDRPGVNSALEGLDANNIYGYDQAYDNFTTYSLGSARKVTVQGPFVPTSTDFIGSKNNAPTAKFSFTGTGFDVVSLTSGDSGCLWVSVKDTSGNPVRSIVVSNYYGYQYDDATNSWVVVNGASDTLYQVPVVKVEDLAYGTYDVEMKVVYLASQDMQKAGSYTVYLDAIRVYNPAQGNKDAENAYKADNEYMPTYVNISDHIVNGFTENEYANGIGYVDGRDYTVTKDDEGNITDSDKEAFLSEYPNYGPNNEAYLKENDGFVFKLRYYGEGDPTGGQFHIGAKLATAGTATATPRSATLEVTYQKETSWPTVKYDIKTCTSMFYKGVELTWPNKGTDEKGKSYIETNPIYVRSINNTEGAILSLTDLKITLPVVSASENNVSEDDLKVIVDTEAAGFVKDIWTAESNQVKSAINLTYPTLSLDGEVKYNFYYTIENVDATVEDMGMITWSAKPEDATFTSAENVITGAYFNAETGEYMVQTNGIPAKKLGDYLYFRVYAKLSDGTYVYSNLSRYSAKAYAMDRLANSRSADTKALCVALLNYGAAAQMHFGYNTDNLMNADLTAEQKALVKGYSDDMVDALTAVDTTKASNFVANGAFNKGYPSVSFEGAFAINYYFIPNKSIDGDLTLYCWDLETYNSVEKLTVDNATAKVVMTQTATGEYFGSYTGIAAKQIDETVFVAGVYESEGVRYSTSVVPYSVGTYCVDKVANGSDTMKAFAAETAVFGHYAKIYFDNLQK